MAVPIECSCSCGRSSMAWYRKMAACFATKDDARRRAPVRFNTLLRPRRAAAFASPENNATHSLSLAGTSFSNRRLPERVPLNVADQGVRRALIEDDNAVVGHPQ